MGKKVKRKKDTEKEEVYNIVIWERICNYWQDEKKAAKRLVRLNGELAISMQYGMTAENLKSGQCL